MIDLNRSFDFLFVFLSDNYDNILDWSQLVATSYNVEGNYDIAFKKEVEIKLEDPYNVVKMFMILLIGNRTVYSDNSRIFTRLMIKIIFFLFCLKPYYFEQTQS